MLPDEPVNFTGFKIEMLSCRCDMFHPVELFVEVEP